MNWNLHWNTVQFVFESILHIISLNSTKSFSWSSYRIWILCMAPTTYKRQIMSLVSICKEIVLQTLYNEISYVLPLKLQAFCMKCSYLPHFLSAVSCRTLPAVSGFRTLGFFLILGCLFYWSTALKLFDLHPQSKLEVAFPFLAYWYPVTTDLIKCSSTRCWGSQMVANMTSTGVSAVP